MPSGSSVQTNVVTMLAIIAFAIVAATVLIALRRVVETRQSRPWLPVEDRPPAGLGRLVPVGTQVEDECRRGMTALEHWLLSHRPPGREST